MSSLLCGYNGDVAMSLIKFHKNFYNRKKKHFELGWKQLEEKFYMKKSKKKNLTHLGSNLVSTLSSL